jgi:transcriptional regulator with XRE-family HTH domain
MATTAERDAALLSRLKTLVRDHSQARMARATGRSRTSLTRYLQGARPPLEFGAAIVEELGVNPDWLLTGTEPMYLADVPVGSSELGNELLEMMRAMDDVSRLKLGALAGRDQARALREIADMLRRYDSLRDRLNSMSAPVLAELLEQAEDAAERRRMDRARALLKAAERVQKFCDDRELSIKLIRVRGLVYHIDQDLETALELNTRVFHASLDHEAGLEEIASSAGALALVLRSNGRNRQARRVARIGLSFAEEHEKSGAPYAALLMVDALSAIELGEFDGIAESIAEVASRFRTGEAGEGAEAAKCAYSLYRGVWTPDEISGARVRGFAAAAMILTASYLTEDPEIIEHALNRCREVMKPEMPLNQWHVRRGETMLKAARGKTVEDSRLHEKNLRALTDRTFVQRLTRDRRALTTMLEAQARLDALGQDESPGLLALALHIANVLRGVPPGTRNRKLGALRQRAESMRLEYAERGYGLMAWLAA